MAVLSYLTKLKRGLGLASDAHFLNDFPINVPYLILHQWTKFQCHTVFPSQDKQNVLLKVVSTTFLLVCFFMSKRQHF